MLYCLSFSIMFLCGVQLAYLASHVVSTLDQQLISGIVVREYFPKEPEVWTPPSA